MTAEPERKDAHAHSHRGLHELFTYPLMSAILDRRTRRVARGTSISSGPISYTDDRL